MTVTGYAYDLYDFTREAAQAIALEIERDRDALKKVYDMRLSDEIHKKAWEKAQKGLERAIHVHSKLNELARQLKGLPGQATLDAAECALFSYVQDPDEAKLPEIKFGKTI